MPGLFSIAYADLATRRSTAALTMVAILLGTAVVAATFTTNVAVEDSMTRAASAIVGNADLVVEAIDDQGFAARSVDAVAKLPGVTLVAPQVEKRVFYRTRTRRGSAQVVGIDPELDPQIHPSTLAAGRLLRANDQRAVVLGKDWAATNGIRVGDGVELVTTDGFQRFEVVGLVDEPDVSKRGTGRIRVPLAVAQSSFGFQDRVGSLSLRLADPRQADVVRASLEAVLPYVFIARESSEVLADLRASIGDLQLALSFFGLIALLAGALLVFNSLALTVSARTRELGLLRAVGASVGYIVRLTLAQGLLLGVAGAVLGVIAGQLLAFGLVIAVSRTQGIAAGGIPFSPAGIAVAFVLGVGVTLVASLVPALRAGRTSPLAAMAETRAPAAPTGSGRQRIAAAIAAALVVVLVAPVDANVLRPLRAAAVVLLIPLLIYLSQALIPALTAIAAVPLRRSSRGVTTIAERTVRRERAQTTLTVASFLISLALIVGLANGAASFTSAGQSWAAALFPGEMVVVSPVDQPFEIVDEFKAIPGVDQVSAVSSLPVVWQGVRLTAIAVDPAHYFQAFDLEAGERTAAFKRMRAGDGALIPGALAREMELKVGDTLHLDSSELGGDFTVAGIVTHSLPTADGFGAVILPRDSADALLTTRGFRFLVVSAAPDADLAQLARDLARTAESFGMQAGSQSDLASSIGNAVGGLLGLMAGLVAVGVVVGSLGLVNTMMLQQSLRAREIGIMRAVGLARSKVRTLAVVEAAIMGFLGAVLGVALGGFLTFALVDLGRTADLDPSFSFSAPVAVAVIGGGVVIAILAALYPAARAARSDVLETVRRG